MATAGLLVIGSSSKWRRRVIGDHFGARFAFAQVAPDIDEKSIRGATAEETATLIAEAKLTAVLARLKAEGIAGDFALASDQVARCPGAEVREKPEGPAENRAFLEGYRHSHVETVAATVVVNLATGQQAAGVHCTKTHFGDIPDATIDAIIGRGDSLQCCGGFVIEDVDLSKCVARLEGTVQGVQGVHPPLLARLLRDVGADLPADLLPE